MSELSYLQRFGDIELAVRRGGRGRSLVWGHALMGSMRVEDRAGLWDWSALERHAQVVRYDARGHGNSDGSYRADDYRWEQMARDMLAVARGVSGPREKYLLGGISMGAATALEAALQAPQRVAGLVLALPPTAWETRPRQSAIYRRLARVSALFGAAPYRLLDLLPIPMREDGRNQLAIHTMKGLARANPLHVQAALGGAAASDMAGIEALAGLDVPTLILAWEDDAAHPLATAERLAEHLPDVHDLVVCHPEDVGDWFEALVRFLRQRGGTRARTPASKRRRSRKAA